MINLQSNMLLVLIFVIRKSRIKLSGADNKRRLSPHHEIRLQLYLYNVRRACAGQLNTNVVVVVVRRRRYRTIVLTIISSLRSWATTDV